MKPGLFHPQPSYGTVKNLRRKHERLRLLQRGLLVILLLLLPVLFLAFREPVETHKIEAPDEMRLREFVRLQVEAFQRGDHAAVIADLHPGFPMDGDMLGRNGKHFSAIAGEGSDPASRYHPIRTAHRVAFGGVHAQAEQALIEIFFSSEHGVVTPAVYTLAPDASGLWKVKDIQFRRSYRQADTDFRLEI